MKNSLVLYSHQYKSALVTIEVCYTLQGEIIHLVLGRRIWDSDSFEYFDSEYLKDLGDIDMFYKTELCLKTLDGARRVWKHLLNTHKARYENEKYR